MLKLFLIFSCCCGIMPIMPQQQIKLEFVILGYFLFDSNLMQGQEHFLDQCTT